MNHLYIFDEKGLASNYGVGKYIQNVISVCNDHDISVTVVSLNIQRDAKSSIYEDGSRHIQIPLLKDSEGKLWDLDQKNDREQYCLYVITVLENYISPSDKILFHLNYTQDFYLAKNLKNKWPSSKVILTVHYFTWCLALGGNTNHLAHIMAKEEEKLSEYERAVIYSALFEQKLFKLVDSIICLSDFAKRILVTYYEIPEIKLHLIPNGIKDSFLPVDKKTLRKKYGISEDEKMLLFVGRLEDKKGLQYLIEAFKKLALQDVPNSHLYIIGDGHFHTFLPLCYPLWRKITFCGRILPEHVADFYCMSDIGILPSLTEQCSFVAIEMLMHGLPMIGTDSSGLDEMIIDGVNGFKIHLQEKEDHIDFPVEELINRTNELLHSSSLSKYEKQSRNLYLQQYTYTCMQDKLCQLYTFCFEG